LQGNNGYFIAVASDGKAAEEAIPEDPEL